MEMRMKYNDLKYFGAKLATLVLLLIGIAMELSIFDIFGPVAFGLKFLISLLIVIITVGITFLALYMEELTLELLGETDYSCTYLLGPIILNGLAVVQFMVAIMVGIWLLLGSPVT